jgi:hypothetical protein
MKRIIKRSRDGENNISIDLFKETLINIVGNIENYKKGAVIEFEGCTFKKEMIVLNAGCSCQLPPYPYIDYNYRVIETYYFPNVATFYYGCNGTADIPNPWGDASSNNTRIETKTPILC